MPKQREINKKFWVNIIADMLSNMSLYNITSKLYSRETKRVKIYLFFIQLTLHGKNGDHKNISDF